MLIFVKKNIEYSDFTLIDGKTSESISMVPLIQGIQSLSSQWDGLH